MRNYYGGSILDILSLDGRFYKPKLSSLFELTS